MKRILNLIVALTLALGAIGQECNIIYVSPNGNGSGTRNSPTSIANALGLVVPGTDHIWMQVGQYSINAPIQLISGVTIEGGFNAGTWEKTNTGITLIQRTNANVETNPNRLVAIEAVGLTDFHLHDLHIQGADAVGNGITTYGIYLNGCSNYTLNRLRVTAGNGSNGVDGVAGVDGVNGVNGAAGLNGNACGSGNTGGGAGGSSWSGGSAAGGNGGDGGQEGTTASIGWGGIVDGEGYDGSVGQNGQGVNGGNGGNGGIGYEINLPGPCGFLGIPLFQNCQVGVQNFGLNGQTAPADGADGADGMDGIPSHSGGWFMPGDGQNGVDGVDGSGGGGGGGGGSFGENIPFMGTGSGSGGGGGGEGGQGGTGATGGTGGGGSFGLYITNNSTGGYVYDCKLFSGLPGMGGVGGFPGGIGGQGGIGGTAGAGCGRGGDGGDGSDGGNGGFGGNGATGISQDFYIDPLGTQAVVSNMAQNVEPAITVANKGCTFHDIDFTTNSNGIIQWYYEGTTVPANTLGSPSTVEYSTMGAQDVSMVSNGVPYILTNFVSIFIDGQPYLPTIQASSTTVCPNQNVNFSATWPTSFPVLGYRWNFGDPSSGAQNTSSQATPSHSYANPGTYLVTLQTNSNCCGWSKPDSLEITVLPNVTPQVFVTASSTEICEGESITLGAVPYFGGPTPTFQWFHNGVQQGTGISYTPAAVNNGDQIYVRMTSSYPCPPNAQVNSEIITIIVHPLPVVDCSTVTNSYLGAQTGFNANVSVGTAPYTFAWQFGDGGFSDLQSPTHLYGSTGQYNVSVTATDTFGCSTTCNVLVDIILPPYVYSGFVESVTNICGSTTVQFTDTTFGNPIAWQWDFGDGSPISNQQNPSHTYTGLGPYSVTLIADNGVFYDTIVKPNLVEVWQIPTADFLPAETEVCDSATIRFYDNSIGASQWQWDFGDASSGSSNTSDIQNPSHQFNVAGTYTINLTVTTDEGCTAQAQPRSVIVNRSPIAGFYTDTNWVCTDLPVPFYDTSKYAIDITNTYWRFYQGQPWIEAIGASTLYWTYTEPGWYWVEQLVVNGNTGCRDSMTLGPIIVVEHPQSSFFPDSIALQLPDTAMQFWNTSQYAHPDSTFWNFGNGYTVNNVWDAVGIYQDSGLFNVQLIVMNELGCPDTSIVPFRVWEQETFFIQTAFSPNGDGLNDEFVIIQKGIIDFHMQVFDRWGKLAWQSFDVNRGWDGTHRDSKEPMPQGAYAYTIDLTWYTGKKFSTTGTITLLR